MTGRHCKILHLEVTPVAETLAVCLAGQRRSVSFETMDRRWDKVGLFNQHKLSSCLTPSSDTRIKTHCRRTRQMIGETLSPKMKFPQFLLSSRMDFGLLMFTGLG